MWVVGLVAAIVLVALLVLVFDESGAAGKAMASGFGIIGVLLCLAIPVGLLALLGLRNVVDEREQAEGAAIEWARGMRYTNISATCESRSNEGSVHCTIAGRLNEKDVIAPLECASALSVNSGCRVQRSVGVMAR